MRGALEWAATCIHAKFATVALITGATSGIGIAAARRFAWKARTGAPGPVELGGNEAGAQQGLVDYLASLIPLGRVGDPDEIAKAAVFLASDAHGKHFLPSSYLIAKIVQCHRKRRNSMSTSRKSPAPVWAKAAPALLMMILAPAFTELLLGGTRFSTLVAFPPVLLMEILVWGGGAVLLRGLARKLKLGWASLALFALALAVAEEFVIQQTSLAPLVIRLEGVEWGRAGGLNYVYALWALAYEAAWVVLFPTWVAEAVFPDRRDETWLNKPMAGVLSILFVLGATMAWFAWTHIARVQTFHQAIYNPGRLALFAAILVIGALFAYGIKRPPRLVRAGRPPNPAVIALLGGLWGTIWFVLVVLAFGIAPQLPAPAVFVAGAIVLLLAVFVLARWTSDAAWTQKHAYFLFTGTLTGAMVSSFLGFRGAALEDIVFKVITNAIALLLMLLLGRKMAVRRAQHAATACHEP